MQMPLSFLRMLYFSGSQKRML